mmetsp:Transcript_11008/g.29089  ORF Transcript_11008/g.29089 Transcript_11008/m.29089 type:complete len:207 (-) Transcript_11008:51-671(-)
MALEALGAHSNARRSSRTNVSGAGMPKFSTKFVGNFVCRATVLLTKRATLSANMCALYSSVTFAWRRSKHNFDFLPLPLMGYPSWSLKQSRTMQTAWSTGFRQTCTEYAWSAVMFDTKSGSDSYVCSDALKASVAPRSAVFSAMRVIAAPRPIERSFLYSGFFCFLEISYGYPEPLKPWRLRSSLPTVCTKVDPLQASMIKTRGRS